MKLAFPGVVSQPGFRRRIFASVLNCGQVLRENDAAFEFKPARVFAAGQVNGTAGLPKRIPVFLCRALRLRERWQVFYR
jgi:hypothetical protein